MLLRACKKLLLHCWRALVGLSTSVPKTYARVASLLASKKRYQPLKAQGTTPQHVISLQDAGATKPGKQAHVDSDPSSEGVYHATVALLITLCAAVICAAFFVSKKSPRQPPQAAINAYVVHKIKHTPKPKKKLNFAIAPQKAGLFIGRAAATKRLAPYFQQSDKLVVLPPITGPEGAGKTQLAHQLIDQQEAHYDHIIWINAATTQDIEESYRQTAKELGMQPVPNEDPQKEIAQLIASVHHSLQDKHVLYVFDNAPNLSTIQPYWHNGTILITSKHNKSTDWTSPAYDELVPLALAPFSPEEALQLAQAMGQDITDPSLPALIQLLPRYPLVMKQLFSNVSMQKKDELIHQLNRNSKEPATYRNILSTIIKSKLAALQSLDNSAVLLQLLQEIALLAPQPIPLSFVVALGHGGSDKQISDMLSTLAKHGLIGQNSHSIYMLSAIQATISDLAPLTTEQKEAFVQQFIDYDIDKAATTSYPISYFYHQMIPHAEKLLKYVQTQYGEDAHTAQCRLQLSRLYYQQGNYARARKLGKKALLLLIREPDNPTNNIHIAFAADHLGNVYYKQGAYSKALKLYQNAFDMYQVVYGAHAQHPDIARVANNLGNVYYKQGEYAKAGKLYAQSRDMYEKIYAEDPHPSIANAYNNLGNISYQQGEVGKALAWYQKALDMYAALYGDTPHTGTANVYDNLGNVYDDQQQYDDAIAFHEKALDMREKIYGAIPHPDIALAYHNLGTLYYHEQLYQKSLSFFKAACDMQRTIYGNIPHPDTAFSCNNLALVYRKQGMIQQALKCHEQALEMFHELNGDGKLDQKIALAYTNLGNAYRDHRQYNDAINAYTKALALFKSTHGEKTPHAHIAALSNNIGNLYRDQADYEDALTCYNAAITILKKIYGEDHPSIARTYNNIGLTYYKQEQYDDAIDAYEKALNSIQEGQGKGWELAMAASYKGLSSVYAAQWKFAKALAYSRKKRALKSKQRQIARKQ